ncbi:MAG: EI24 domain-containing protein [Leptothrix sp. (in: b-proteobacteria)]
MLDAFWRAAAYCFHPRVILLSLAPIIVIGSVAFGLAWFYWTPAVDAVRDGLTGMALLAPLMSWLDQLSGGALRAVIGPLVVVAVSVPVLLISALLLVSLFMGPAIVSLVARRRFPDLVRRDGAPWWQALSWSLGSTLLALLALVLTLPLWLIPPLALLLPPLIWGWLSYRVMSFDALSEHANRAERRELMRQHRWPLFSMGLITGYLGAAPSLVWATGALMLPMMPLLVPIFVWLYTIVFAFASLWFAHYCLAALHALRAQPIEASARPVTAVTPAPSVLPPPSF